MLLLLSNGLIPQRNLVILQKKYFKIIYNIAQSYKRSIYDSIYIAIAQIMEAEFWTADKKLYNAVSNKLQFVKWIEDYR